MFLQCPQASNMKTAYGVLVRPLMLHLLPVLDPRHVLQHVTRNVEHCQDMTFHQPTCRLPLRASILRGNIVSTCIRAHLMIIT